MLQEIVKENRKKLLKLISMFDEPIETPVVETPEESVEETETTPVV